jgi:hypothetical protein
VDLLRRQGGTLSDEIHAVEMGAMTSVVTRLTTDDAISSKYPDAGAAGDRVAIMWFDTVSGNEDVYLAAGPASRLLRADALTTLPSHRVTATPGHSIGAYLAWSGERVGVAWCDDSVGQHEVFVQSFDASGQPSGEPARLTDTAASSLIPAIRPWRSGFALAWSEYAVARDGTHGEGRGQIAFTLVR